MGKGLSKEGESRAEQPQIEHRHQTLGQVGLGHLPPFKGQGISQPQQSRCNHLQKGQLACFNPPGNPPQVGDMQRKHKRASQRNQVTGIKLQPGLRRDGEHSRPHQTAKGHQQHPVGGPLLKKGPAEKRHNNNIQRS